MSVTNFPNGISQGLPDGSTGQFAGGTIAVPSGAAGTSFESGLAEVDWVVASPLLAGAAVAGFAGCGASSSGGGTVQVIGVSGAGTASTAAGTATWLAFGR